MMSNGVTLNFPYQKKAEWLHKKVGELENEKRLLTDTSEMHKKVIEKLWQEMACLPSLELALMRAKREQMCRSCGAGGE